MEHQIFKECLTQFLIRFCSGPYKTLFILFFFIPSLVYGSEKYNFVVDINGDQKTDLVMIENQGPDGLRIDQYFSNESQSELRFLNSFSYNDTILYDKVYVAKLFSQDETNLILSRYNVSGRDFWIFRIKRNSLQYIEHDFVPMSQDTQVVFSNVLGDGLDELIAIRDFTDQKQIEVNSFNGSFVLQGTSNLMGSQYRGTSFLDLNNDGVNELILSANYALDKRIWTFSLINSVFTYHAFSNLPGDAYKELKVLAQGGQAYLALVDTTEYVKSVKLYKNQGYLFQYQGETSVASSTSNLKFTDLNADSFAELIALSENDYRLWLFNFDVDTPNITYTRFYDLTPFKPQVPEHRLPDWTTAGYKPPDFSGEVDIFVNLSTHNSIPENCASVQLSGYPSTDDSSLCNTGVGANECQNYENNTSAIDASLELAKKIHQCYPNYRVNINFKPFVYKLNSPIVLCPEHSNTYLVGAGRAYGPRAVNNQSYTKLVYDQPSTLNTNNCTKKGRKDLILFEGKKPDSNDNPNPAENVNVLSYDTASNSIIVNDSSVFNAGDFLEFTFANGSWHEPEYDDNFYTGFTTNISNISGNQIFLSSDFSVAWNQFKESENEVKVKLVTPIKNVGVSKMSLSYETQPPDGSSLVKFGNAQNGIVEDVSFNKINSAGAEIAVATNIEVRYSYFDDAFDHGDGGRAYGTNITSTASFNKVENNIYRRLRHSMLVSRGASHNVFGYNYSREQTDQLGNSLSDLNIHGGQAYANLFEGNRVDQIEADDTHGPGGKFNTFLRNYTYFDKLRLVYIESTNVVGNILRNGATIDFAGHDDPNSLNTFEFISEIFSRYTPVNETFDFLNDVSYYLDDAPSFFNSHISSGAVSWPAIGPRTIDYQLIMDDIPARVDWCSVNPC